MQPPSAARAPDIHPELFLVGLVIADRGFDAGGGEGIPAGVPGFGAVLGGGGGGAEGSEGEGSEQEGLAHGISLFWSDVPRLARTRRCFRSPAETCDQGRPACDRGRPRLVHAERNRLCRGLEKLEMFCFGSGMPVCSEPWLRSSASLPLPRVRGDSRDSTFFGEGFGKSVENSWFRDSTNRLSIEMPDDMVECRRHPAWRFGFAAAIRGGK